MSARTLAILSLALNVILLAGVWRASRPAAASIRADADFSDANAAVRLKTNLTRVEVTLTNELPPFRWEQVQSAELTNYVAGLRGIGCPEETIRDIIGGELIEQYLARRRVALEPWQRRYWDLAVHGLGKAKEEFGKELDKLKAETIEQLDDIVGEHVSETEEPNPTRLDTRFDFLSEDKRRQLADLDKQFNEMENRPPRGRNPMTPEQKARLKELKDQRVEAVRAVLTPEEFEEYRLRTSRYATVGRGLTGFDATEDDLRALTRTYEQFSSADESLDRKAADYEARRKQQQELKRQRDEALKTQFGEERYAEFKRAQDGNFREIFQVAERYGLPRETAVQVDELRRVAQENMNRVRNNTALGAEQRQEMIRAIQEETRAAMTQAFGERAARTYERNGGEWLRDGR